ncbi:unnamed protein product [Chrysoparadoxa australica]
MSTHIPCRYGERCHRADCFYGHPAGRNIGAGAPPGPMGAAPPRARSTVQVCRYGWDCTRSDCYFQHPGGRAIDGGARGGADAGSVNSIDRQFAQMNTRSTPDQDLMDTWFPKAMNCTCCKGFIYGCKNDICASLGSCTCDVEEKDMDEAAPAATSERPEAAAASAAEANEAPAGAEEEAEPSRSATTKDEGVSSGVNGLIAEGAATEASA